jgi:hypothetical protein
MKKFFAMGLFFIANSVFASDLSGTWQCHETDTEGGYTPKEVMILTKNAQHSDASRGYMAYDIQISIPGPGGDNYKGGAVSAGDSLTIWFAGIKDPTDTGVGLTKVEHHLNKDGTYTDQFTDFVFEPIYGKKGSHGYETCEKLKD